MSWYHDATVYHLYPLGALGAPARNDFRAAPVPRLAALVGWLDHWQALGIDTLYLGPVFESTTHGYDTADYFAIDRRLGNHDTLTDLVTACHARGIRVVLDAVLNHVGRDHAAFRDLQRHGAASTYAPWFSGLRFDRGNAAGDPFDYATWAGVCELPKLDTSHPEVRAHLFAAVDHWISRYDIDGLRLDAADCLAGDFLTALAEHCRARKPEFWLLGEVVHGDYRRQANADMCHATTNYEAYKGLWSSHNDGNYFEIAHTLDRQFGPRGLYRDLPLVNFADNHDVDRIASTLRHTPHLFPLHVLLFAMPGVPAIYYGSEWAVPGRKVPGSDAPLRPALAPPAATPVHPLAVAIARLSRLRRRLPALRAGSYRPLHVAARQIVFERATASERAVVAVNASDVPAVVEVALPPGHWVDRLNGDEVLPGGRIRLIIPPTWGRILTPAG